MLRMVRRGLVLAWLLGGCDVVFGLERDPEPPPVPGEWLAVSSGGVHSCAIQTDHSLWCWGDNAFGSTGVGLEAGVEILAPVRVGEERWNEVSAGGGHTCALREDATLWCWGNNAAAALGDATHETRDTPVQIGVETWRAVSAGEVSTCGVRTDGSLWCWGANWGGQVGDGTRGERVTPTLIDGTRAFRSVSVGLGHACAVTEGTGHLWCWGTIGSATEPFTLVPKRLHPEQPWARVVAGAGFTCGLSGGRVLCWGDDNSLGQLGDGTQSSRPDPQIIASDRTDWILLAGRSHTMCAIAGDGTTACWGENRRGQIGSDTAQPLQLEPHVLPAPWNAIAPGTMHACAIDLERRLWCAGANGVGSRGDGTGGSQLVPQELDGTWSALETGATHTCGLRNGQLLCWGDNAWGQLGDGTILSRQVPAQTLMPSPSATLAVGESATCDADEQRRIWCWGNNQEAQLAGVTQAAYSPAPLLFVGSSNVVAMSASVHACAHARDSAAVCWGRNTVGQLGRGTATPMETSTATVTTSGSITLLFERVATGYEHSCGITVGDHQIYCWGRNTEGQLGDGDTVNSAFAVGTGHHAKAIAAGAFHTCAITLFDMLECWGANGSGQLGDGGAMPLVRVPVQIGTASWSAVSAGTRHTCGIQRDGTLWCWGGNGRGPLGDGTRMGRASPVQIGTARWSSVTAGEGYTCGIQVDGSGWCWGTRLWGQLGDNRAWTTKYAPVEVAQ